MVMPCKQRNMHGGDDSVGPVSHGVEACYRGCHGDSRLVSGLLIVRFYSVQAHYSHDGHRQVTNPLDGASLLTPSVSVIHSDV